MRPLLKLDYCRIGPFRVIHMVRHNVVRLDLGSSYSRLHPVFNVSLLTPYVDPVSAGRPSTASPSVMAPSVLPLLHCWRHVSGILDFQIRGRQAPEYLLRWVDSTPSDNTWVPLHNLLSDLDPYLLHFHSKYSSFAAKDLASVLWEVGVSRGYDKLGCWFDYVLGP